MNDVPDHALRDGLRGLPVPAVSPDFDVRILAALSARQSWWQRLWQPARPLLTGASFSLIVTLALLHWTLSAPVTAPHPPMLGEPERIQATAPSLDALLNRPNLSVGSLSIVWDSPPTPNSGGAGVSETPLDRQREPRRRAQIFRRPSLIA